jgi:hypothetical protein
MPSGYLPSCNTLFTAQANINHSGPPQASRCRCAKSSRHVLRSSRSKDRSIPRVSVTPRPPCLGAFYAVSECVVNPVITKPQPLEERGYCDAHIGARSVPRRPLGRVRCMHPIARHTRTSTRRVFDRRINRKRRRHDGSLVQVNQTLTLDGLNARAAILGAPPVSLILLFRGRILRSLRKILYLLEPLLKLLRRTRVLERPRQIF